MMALSTNSFVHFYIILPLDCGLYADLLELLLFQLEHIVGGL